MMYLLASLLGTASLCVSRYYRWLRQCEGSSIVVIVTPLQSLMVDQHDPFSRVGLRVKFVRSCQDDQDALIRVRQGQAPLVYISPKQLLYSIGVNRPDLGGTVPLF